MGYELNKLMERFGVTSPTIMYSGGLTPEQKPAFEQYKADYLKRIASTPMYDTPVASKYVQMPVNPNAAPTGRPNWAAPIKAPTFDEPLVGGGGEGGAGGVVAQPQAAATPAAQPSAAAPSGLATLTQGGTANGAGQFDTRVTQKAPFYMDAVQNQLQRIQNVQSMPYQEYQLPTVAGLSPEQLRAIDYANQNVGRYQGVVDQSLQRLRGFADGGAVRDVRPPIDQEEDTQNYPLRNLIPKALAAKQGNLQAEPTAQIAQPARMNMQELLSKYLEPRKSAYADDLKAAKEASAQHRAAFEQLVQKAIANPEEAGPSKSEMYYRLAQAFGNPGKTGHFSEALTNAVGTLGDYEKEKREAQQVARQNQLKLGMDVAQMHMKSAKEDEQNLRQLASQEAVSERDVRGKLLADYLKSGQPQSEAGKIAVDAGLKMGTPEYTAFVEKYVKDKLESGDIFKMMAASTAQGQLALSQERLALAKQDSARKAAEAAKLTPQELKMKQDLDLALATLRTSYKDLQRAVALNPNTFDGSLLDTTQYKAAVAAKSKDPKVTNTAELQNILKHGALTEAATTLKTQISDADIKMLQSLQGIDAENIDARAKILKRVQNRVAIIYKVKQQQLKDILAGKYRLTTPEAASPELPSIDLE